MTGVLTEAQKLRWRALRMAEKSAPRLANGTSAENIVARAQVFEDYLRGESAGSGGIAPDSATVRKTPRAPDRPGQTG